MPIFVKSHRRGNSVVKAYNRAQKLGQVNRAIKRHQASLNFLSDLMWKAPVGSPIDKRIKLQGRALNRLWKIKRHYS